MNISIWDEIKEWTVSAESLRRRFVQRLEKPSSIFEGPVLYLPSAWDIFASTSKSKWLTDIEDSSLDRFRIVKMGEWGKLCEIERDGGKIIRNIKENRGRWCKSNLLLTPHDHLIYSFLCHAMQDLMLRVHFTM